MVKNLLKLTLLTSKMKDNFFFFFWKKGCLVEYLFSYSVCQRNHKNHTKESSGGHKYRMGKGKFIDYFVWKIIQ